MVMECLHPLITLRTTQTTWTVNGLSGLSKFLLFNYHSVDQSHIFSIRIGVTDQIKISFLNFNTEQCYDYVELRDGGDDTSPLVGK